MLLCCADFSNLSKSPLHCVYWEMRKSFDNHWKETMRLKTGLLLALLTTVVVGCILVPILHWWETDYVLIAGIVIILSSTIYFKWIFPYCTFIVPADKAWIMSNQFVNESAKFQAEFTGYRKIRAQKEFQAGFHWKYPWETTNLEIDMSRQAAIQQRPEEIYTLKDGNLVIIRWRIFYGPLPGSLVNFIRTKPDLIEHRIRDRVERFIQSTIGELEQIGYGRHQLDLFKEKFEEIYGGPNTIDPEERELGVWTGTPEILDIDEPRDAQEVRYILDTASKAVEASKGKMSFEEARGILLASKINGTQVDVLELARGRTLTK